MFTVEVVKSVLYPEWPVPGFEDIFHIIFAQLIVQVTSFILQHEGLNAFKVLFQTVGDQILVSNRNLWSGYHTIPFVCLIRYLKFEIFSI